MQSVETLKASVDNLVSRVNAHIEADAGKDAQISELQGQVATLTAAHDADATRIVELQAQLAEQSANPVPDEIVSAIDGVLAPPSA